MYELRDAGMSAINRQHVAHLLGEFARDVPGIVHAWAVASDGLMLAHTASLPVEPAERLAASVAGFSGLATQVNSELQGGGLELILVEMVAGYLIIMQVAGGCRLAALTEASSDTGQVAYQMQRLADRIGEMALSVPARHG